jgi:hypothetical protein
MPEQQKGTEVPDFSIIFAKMSETENAETTEVVGLVEEQVETLRILQQAVPDNEFPYVSTFMSM